MTQVELLGRLQLAYCSVDGAFHLVKQAFNAGDGALDRGQ